MIATTFANPGTVPPARRQAPVGADRYRPSVLLTRGRAKVAIVDGIFAGYVAGARKGDADRGVAAVGSGRPRLYDQVERIHSDTHGQCPLISETRESGRLEELAKTRFGAR